MNRRMAVLAAVSAFVLSGCGGADPAPAPTPTPPEPAAPTTTWAPTEVREAPADCGPGVAAGVVAPCVIRLKADGTGTIYDATGRVIGYGTP